MVLPEVSLDKSINKEGQLELDDSDKPQVTFLVSCYTFSMDTSAQRLGVPEQTRGGSPKF